MTKTIRIILQASFSLCLLALLLFSIDLSDLKISLARANPLLLLLALLIVTINRIIMSFKWNLLLRAKRIHLSWFEVLRLYYISNFAGVFLPSTLGTDTVKAYYVKKKGHMLSDVISSVLVERTLGLFVLLLCAMLGISFFGKMELATRLNTPVLFWTIAVCACLVICLFILSFSSRLNRVVNDYLLAKNSRLLVPLAKMIIDLYNSYQEYRTHKKVLIIFSAFTCLELFTYILRCYVVASAFEVTLPLLYFCIFVPIVLVFMRLPISIHGFGISEAGFVYFLSIAGFSQTTGFSVGIVDHFIILIGITPGLFFYFFWQVGMDIRSKVGLNR